MFDPSNTLGLDRCFNCYEKWLKTSHNCHGKVCLPDLTSCLILFIHPLLLLFLLQLLLLIVFFIFFFYFFFLFFFLYFFFLFLIFTLFFSLSLPSSVVLYPSLKIHHFFYKNIVFKNLSLVFEPKFKNKLRTSSGLFSGKKILDLAVFKKDLKIFLFKLLNLKKIRHITIVEYKSFNIFTIKYYLDIL